MPNRAQPSDILGQPTPCVSRWTCGGAEVRVRRWCTGGEIETPSTRTTSASCSSATVAQSRRRKYRAWWYTKGMLPFGPSLLFTSEFADGPPVFEKIDPPTEGSLTSKNVNVWEKTYLLYKCNTCTFRPAEGAGRR